MTVRGTFCLKIKHRMTVRSGCLRRNSPHKFVILRPTSIIKTTNKVGRRTFYWLFIAASFPRGVGFTAKAVRKDKRIYTRTRFNSCSKAYKAGLLPDASRMVRTMPRSRSMRVNLAAVGAGMPLADANRLFRKIGCVKMKSSALRLYLDERVSAKMVFMSSYNERIPSATRMF
jgi:hypothetical protein